MTALRHPKRRCDAASALIVWAFATALSSCSTRPSAPDATKVQVAVDQSLDWLKLSGNCRVLGVQEIPEANSATADLQFADFEYKVNGAMIPVAKTAEPPRPPDINSPNFYQEMARMGSMDSMIQRTRYSGDGQATLTLYTDGRWSLTKISFSTSVLNVNHQIY